MEIAWSIIFWWKISYVEFRRELYILRYILTSALYRTTEITLDLKKRIIIVELLYIIFLAFFISPPFLDTV